MAIVKHISDGTNTYDLPSGEAFKIELTSTLSNIAAGGTWTLPNVKTAELKAAIAANQPIAFLIKSSGNPQQVNEILINNLGNTGGSGLALTNAAIVLMNSNTLKIMKVVFSGNATNVTSVTLTDVTPTSGAANLYDLQDVNIFNAQGGDVLTYDNNSGTWINLPGGGGGGSQLPVVIDIGRIIHQNGMPQNIIADVPQNHYTIPFDRQVIFTYRAYEQGQMYNRYWTITPCAYKINIVSQSDTVIGNAEDLHWLVDDLNTQGQLPLASDIRYKLSLYTVLNNSTFKIDIDLFLSVNTTMSKIEFYLDSTNFNVMQVQYPGADN